MKLPFGTMTVALALLSSTNSIQAACRVSGDAYIEGRPEFNIPPKGPQGASSEPIFSDNERLTFNGNEMPTNIGSVEGSDLSFNKAVTPGFLMFGPSVNQAASELKIEASMQVTIKWAPDMYEYCSKHKTVISKGRKCVEKKVAAHPTNFVVDITTDGGTNMLYSRSFANLNDLTNGKVVMPEVKCDGSVTGFETRIRDLIGGSVNFKVHQVVVEKYWNN